VIGEIFGSLPAEGSTSYGERSLTSLELLLGAKHDWSTNLALHAGAGAGLIQGVASPDWRVYTGVNYTFGPLWAVNESSESGYRHLTQILPQDPEPAAPVERFRTRNILFEFDSDRMLGEFAAALEELATHLRSGFRELVIEGHTDSIGAAGYNQRLSQKRAIAIKRHLSTKLNIDASKIVTIGFGETRPIADNGNYQGRQENRRVEFEIKR
jgi:outer membrane protein OmpA-like peptidoglycan-associated protein